MYLTKDPQQRTPRVLVVEDDSAINDVICRQLSRLGVVPEPTFSGTEANRALDSEDFDLVVTDLMLPGMAGEQVIELIRNRDALVPIVVVSARTETRDKVDILGLGADDYLTKPFDLDELSARIQAQLRRSLALRLIKDDPDNENQPATLAIDILNINVDQRTLAIEDTVIPLTRTEFELLELLARYPKRVFTKQKLYEHIWNDTPPVDDNTITTHISNLRSKLKPYGADAYIQTVWGIGFKLEVPPS
ncbi:response regulator transcription factor [Gordonibacter urolithinfaciens]|uniref:response regulator transcription factor n=1 Tax=Gordonibacter urolithinfaciens TaxID=1335613 RepID=UPI001D07A31B|nr:response regulator transcription factor [Gordonibacter urolithinfaciens]MCB6560643.1 response regulator transcription factor [Gordonibacter urolithinfaciens]